MRKLAILLFVAACDGPLPAAQVDYEIDAPLCGMVLPVSLWIDDIQVGVDTLRVNAPPSRVRTRAFEVSPGSHTMAVRFYPSDNLIQQDSAVMLKSGQAYTFTFGFYCS